MRCSVRESYGLRPSMFTSTPISNRKRTGTFTLFESSPIPESSPRLFSVPEPLAKYQIAGSSRPISVFKVVGNNKYPLYYSREGTSKLSTQQSYPPMVVISDSEEEDNEKEISIRNKLISSVGRKALKEEDNGQDNIKKEVRNRNVVKPVKDEVLRTDSRRTVKRVSRVAAIIDEIMNERKSSIAAPSPMLKVKTEDRIDTVIDEVKNEPRTRRVTRSSVLTSKASNILREKQHPSSFIPNFTANEGKKQLKAVEVKGKTKDSLNKEKSNNIRTARKRTKTISTGEEEKENNIQLKKENKSLSNEEESKSNLARLSKSSIKAEPFNEVLPVLYKHDDVEENEWDPLNNHKGVYVKKNFQLLGISSGFVKIESRCWLNFKSSKSQIFNIAEGRGIFSYDSDNMKMKIAPGDILTVPSGFPCKFMNTGVKKNLIISFTKVEDRE